jgi:HSP20 family protein
MTLIRYEYPNNNLSEFDRMFERAFSNFGRWSNFGDDRGLGGRAVRVLVDLYDDKDNFYVRAELPGVKKKDIKLELDNAVLTLSGERKTKSGESEETTSFSRSINVAEDIQSDKVKGNFEDGILTVTLPKSEERKPRAISIG